MTEGDEGGPRNQLRRRAEELLKLTRADVAQMPLPEIHRLVHELQVHHIELDLQNDELRRVELALIGSRDRLADLYEFAPVAYLTTDADGVIRESNLTAAALLGVERSRLYGTALWRFIEMKDRDQLHVHRHALKNDGDRAEDEVRVCRPDGTVLTVRMASVRRGNDGEVHVALTDLTAVRKAEAELQAVTAGLEQQVALRTADAEHRAAALAASEHALRLSESRLRAIVETAADAIVTFDRGGRIETFNPAAERTFGWRASETRGKEPAFLVAEPRVEEWMPLGGPSGPAPWREVLGRRRDGATIPLEVAASTVDVDGARTVTVMFRDLTERKRLEGELRQGQKMEAVGRLASGIAHEINNLLMGVRGGADMCLAAVEPGSPIRPLLEKLRDSAVSGGTLMRELMVFGRRVDDEATGVTEIDEAVARNEVLLRRMLGEDVELRVTLAAPCASIGWSAGRLEQVLMNLAINSRQAMPAGGTLAIDTSAQELGVADLRVRRGLPAGRYVILAVGDTGCGMDEETRSRAFEPFFTTKGVTEGTGLGLSTVYGLVKKAGGHVEIESDPGWGTLVTILLPVVEARALEPLMYEDRPSWPAAPTRGARVLLVEDDELVREAIHHYLVRAGYVVDEAGDGAEALRICREQPAPFDLVITDMALPRMSGADLVRAIEPLAPNARVLFISAYPAEELRRRGGLPPGTRSLEKPFSAESLLVAVRDCLG